VIKTTSSRGWSGKEEGEVRGGEGLIPWKFEVLRGGGSRERQRGGKSGRTCDNTRTGKELGSLYREKGVLCPVRVREKNLEQLIRGTRENDTKVINPSEERRNPPAGKKGGEKKIGSGEKGCVDQRV